MFQSNHALYVQVTEAPLPPPQAARLASGQHQRQPTLFKALGVSSQWQAVPSQSCLPSSLQRPGVTYSPSLLEIGLSPWKEEGPIRDTCKYLVKYTELNKLQWTSSPSVLFVVSDSFWFTMELGRHLLPRIPCPAIPSQLLWSLACHSAHGTWLLLIFKKQYLRAGCVAQW